MLYILKLSPVTRVLLETDQYGATVLGMYLREDVPLASLLPTAEAYVAYVMTAWLADGFRLGYAEPLIVMPLLLTVIFSL